MKNLMTLVSLLFFLGGALFVGFPPIHVDLASATSTFTNSTVESIDPSGGISRFVPMMETHGPCRFRKPN